MIGKTVKKNISKQRSLKFKPTLQRLNRLIFFFFILFLSSTKTIKAQQVSLSNVQIKNSSEGFVVSGTVNSTDLNPEKQIVESDYLSVLAEIPIESSYSFPLLWESMVIRPPAEAETPYTKGGKYLSKIEFNGQNIETVKLLGSSAIRKVTVWREYGGLNEWRNNAPESVETDFEGVIPVEYSGLQVRIRATLKHTFGGPYAAWSAYTFAHDTTNLTLNKSADSAAAEDKSNQDSDSAENNQGSENDDKASAAKPVNQVSDKVKDVVNAAISIFKNKKNKAQPNEENETGKIEMASFPEPEPAETDSASQNDSQQAEEVKKIIDKLAQNNQTKTDFDQLGKIIQDLDLSQDIQLAGNAEQSSAPDDTFQKKYWLNKYLLDPFVDKVSSYVPIGKYYKDYVKSDKDNLIFSSEEEKNKKTALDYNVDKKSAGYFNKYNKIIDQEKKYSTLKNAVPETIKTKPFSWILDKIGWGAKKQYAQSLGKEYKYIRKEINSYTSKTGMSRDEAVKRVKDDYVGFQGDYGNGSFGQVDTGIKWWGSKGKYQDTGVRFDDMVKDMVKNGDI